MQEDQPFLTARELAERWRMAEGSLANMRSAGAGPVPTRFGRAVRYALPDVLAFEAAARGEAA